jgi:hypothetical protein
MSYYNFQHKRRVEMIRILRVQIKVIQLKENRWKQNHFGNLLINQYLIMIQVLRNMIRAQELRENYI